MTYQHLKATEIFFVLIAGLVHILLYCTGPLNRYRLVPPAIASYERGACKRKDIALVEVRKLPEILPLIVMALLPFIITTILIIWEREQM